MEYVIAHYHKAYIAESVFAEVSSRIQEYMFFENACEFL